MDEEQKIEDEQILARVKWINGLVYQLKRRHLEEREEEVLKQALMGKKITAIKVDGWGKKYASNYIAPELWKLLSEIFAQKVGKTNICKVVEDLYQKHLKQSRLNITSDKWVVSEVPKKLNAPVLANELISAHNGERRFLPADRIRHKHSYQKDNYSASSKKLPLLEWLRQLFKVNHHQSQNKTKSSKESTSALFQSSAQTFGFGNLKQTNTKTYGWYAYMKFLKSGLPFLLGFALCGSWYGLSYLAGRYGAQNYEVGKLPQAELGYRIALQFNPWSRSAHYNLALVYEDQQNYQQARAEYQKAMGLGLIAAYNNQARLYILEKKYDTAVSLLEVVLPLIKNQATIVKYSFFKNRGWAELERGQVEEAKVDLEQAIAIVDDDAAAHCLMAQVHQLQNEKKEALTEWENCLRYIQPQIPEENQWMRVAQQKLQPAAEKK